ncbi:MAG: amino acid adenylation domain-containing protein [Lachnospiraceae bacterium]|nr:amino acid adenylation domain-containing protein [Lachnospiraceae bacterium]
MAEIKTLIQEIVKDVLEYEIEIPDKENLLDYGLNSIKGMRIVGLLKKQGVKVSFVDMLKNPTIEGWVAICERSNPSVALSVKKEVDLVEDAFKLTNVQMAYLMGREDGQPLGGISCHVYIEFDNESGVDIQRLKSAWQKLLEMHGMLRACFYENGTQQIRNEAINNEVMVYDLSNASEALKETRLNEIRKELSHRKLDVEKGISSGLAVSILGDKKVRLHFDLDLLVADVVSFKIILDDLTKLYRGDGFVKKNDWSFKQYLAVKEENDRKKYEADKKYWREIIPTLPIGSTLPVATHPENISGAEYSRLQFVLSDKERQQLKKYATDNQTTVAMILLTVYAIILERYSENSEMLINIPLFNRDLSISGSESAVADFTEIMLLDVKVDSEMSFGELLKKIQHNFYEKYEHSSFGGMEIQRDLLVRRNATIIAPMVFSCTEGMELLSEECVEVLGKPGYMITQTPQVYIDFQTFQIGKELRCIWDIPVGLFHENMAEEMFGALEAGIRSIIRRESDCHFKIKELEAIFDGCVERSMKEDCKEAKSEEQNLLTGLLYNIENNPDRIAMIDAEKDRSITYKELAGKVALVAAKLKKAGVKNGDKVVLTVDRGVNEIIGILAIVSVGACYVPITPRQPKERRNKAMETMEVNFVLTDDEKNVSDEESTLIVMGGEAEKAGELLIAEIAPTDSAYVILTSGTTGEPKGVEISHKGAINTIDDVNRRIGLKNGDKVLAVSSIDFDLSVYDIFGTLASGATLIVMGNEHYRDAEFWYKAVLKYNVTVWNTVPMLFDMLLTMAEQEKKGLPLRAVMLSGDWVKSELYMRLRKISEECRFIAMGGATEASIWSNWYEILSENDIRGEFVPYGYALNNQCYRIVDENLRDCPHWVPGELLIGGTGLAKGYCNDIKKTDEKFIMDGGKRWYQTGDRGRYHADGCIEFMGRIDHQCKVRGHRIEVGEVEKCLEKYFEGHRVIVWPEGETGAYNRLLACVFGMEQHPIGTEEEKKILEALKESLPSYMIPNAIYSYGQIPLSTNGKVDRKRISEIFKNPSDIEENGNGGEKDRTSYERLKEIWCENLGVSQEVNATDNYFVMGGDSLKAIRLVSMINKAFGTSLKSRVIFEYQEFGALAQEVVGLCEFVSK